jgi:hypothetical protein
MDGAVGEILKKLQGTFEEELRSAISPITSSSPRSFGLVTSPKTPRSPSGWGCDSIEGIIANLLIFHGPSNGKGSPAGCESHRIWGLMVVDKVLCDAVERVMRLISDDRAAYGKLDKAKCKLRKENEAAVANTIERLDSALFTPITSMTATPCTPDTRLLRPFALSPLSSSPRPSPVQWKFGKDDLPLLPELDLRSAEAMPIVEAFNKDLPAACILKIERVQNPLLFWRFQNAVELVEAEVQNANVQRLYLINSHTSPEEICRSPRGIDHNTSPVCGPLGYGSLFTDALPVANMSAYVGIDCLRKLIIADVVVGKSLHVSQGGLQIRSAPNMPGNVRDFDSVCHAESRWTSVYADYRACPAFIVTYRMSA